MTVYKLRTGETFDIGAFRENTTEILGILEKVAGPARQALADGKGSGRLQVALGRMAEADALVARGIKDNGQRSEISAGHVSAVEMIAHDPVGAVINFAKRADKALELHAGQARQDAITDILRRETRYAEGSLCVSAKRENERATSAGVKTLDLMYLLDLHQESADYRRVDDLQEANVDIASRPWSAEILAQGAPRFSEEAAVSLVSDFKIQPHEVFRVAEQYGANRPFRVSEDAIGDARAAFNIAKTDQERWSAVSHMCEAARVFDLGMSVLDAQKLVCLPLHEIGRTPIAEDFQVSQYEPEYFDVNFSSDAIEDRYGPEAAYDEMPKSIVVHRHANTGDLTLSGGYSDDSRAGRLERDLFDDYRQLIATEIQRQQPSVDHSVDLAERVRQIAEEHVEAAKTDEVDEWAYIEHEGKDYAVNVHNMGDDSSLRAAVYGTIKNDDGTLSTNTHDQVLTFQPSTFARTYERDAEQPREIAGLDSLSRRNHGDESSVQARGI